MKKILLSFSAILFALPILAQNVPFDSIDINNINARINNNGNLFWDLEGKAKFEVPKGSGKTTIFTSTLWVAGLDSIDTLHVAAERFSQLGNDFWSGPVSILYDSAYDAKWNRLWKIEKSEIDYHLAHCWNAGYIPAQSLLEWPGNGDTTLGQLAITAPFYDWNGDGIYNPYVGDYPLIKGDEAVYFILNDDRATHSESGGNKLGVEIHAMAYEFDCISDSALWNTLFLNYKIFNTSHSRYHDSYLGIFTDLDLGHASDDYIGCDVKRGSFYCYNGDDFDGAGTPSSYGRFPPAQSVTILAGPYMGPDGIDNPQIDQFGNPICDESTNGFNFGNGTIDDERYGLRRFVYFNNTAQGANWATTDPDVSNDYYLYLKGFWRDSTTMLWGGGAHDGGSGVCGPECSFMFPGNSDSCYWGTNGMPPYCTPYWTEETVGNMPDDRRGLGSMGPFTFEPGAMQEVDLAFVFGRDYVDSTAWAGVEVMQQRIDSIIKYFRNDSTPCGQGFSGITPVPKANPQINIYPNPTIGFITVDASGMLCDLKYEIFDVLGRSLGRGIIKCTSNQLNISGLDDGIYIINVSDGKNNFSRKFIKQ